MNLNWYAAETLMRQKQDGSAREAWKWSEATQKQSGRFFRRRQISTATPTACLRYWLLLII
ncbi:hypothetical protein [Paenibacillus alginolyticus]|uniref:Uncharacterized protein n=1 Tax=Paenibacillus alginolyticus TaxID=59839 RepID=A0ABT4GDF9_9BACL|nr:hypothetical protein [Paenibacillus alginolyticus]MCY9694191.1 hypothetical protein [Paenibacillus alginolyticus]MEC0142741.1 hypothetical protein [Paenibacillus alginolyticus]